MKDEKDHIDDFFKERSEQGSFEVPDSFLDDINSKLDALDEKKKRRGGFLWLWTLIPIGLIMMYVLWPEDIQTKKTKPIVSIENQESDMESVTLDSMDEHKSESILIADSLTEENIAQEKPLNDTENTSAEELKSLKNVLQNDLEKMNKLADQNTPLWLEARLVENIHEREIKNQDESKSLNAEIDSENKNDETIQTKDDEESAEPKVAASNSDENKKIEGSQIDASMDQNENNLAENIDSVEQIIAEDSITNQTSEIDAEQIDSLLTQREDQDSTLTSEEVTEPIENPEVSKIETEKEAKIGHEIQLFGGMLNSSSNLILGSDSSIYPMNTMESNLWSPSFGFMYRAKINHFDFGVGLSWMQNGEKVNYSTNITQYTDVDSVIFIAWQVDSIYNQNTQTWTVDSIPQFDTTTTTESITDTIIYNNINKYTWISIPLRFGYRFDINKFSIIPRVGLDLSFVSGTNLGTYVEQYNQGLVQKSPSQFVLSYALQLEVRRNFERWHVFVNPYFRSNVTPVISSVIQTRRYNSWGINAGIGLKLK
ncbi:MAG: hypothetical protein ACPG9I_06405 [Crocinitomicaceae bacterium]